MNATEARNGGNFVFFGGSHGIGRATAVALGRRGASVLIVGRHADAAQQAAAAVREAGAASADVVTGDLSTVAGVQAVASSVLAWRPSLHGVLHTAMSAFHSQQTTADGFELAFALQYFARAALNRLLLDALCASGDGRIVHVAGNVPASTRIDLDDLQFKKRKWGFFPAVLGTHVLGYLHVQEAARLWNARPVAIALACVGPTKTKAMRDPQIPLIMRLIGLFGTTPEASSANAVSLLTCTDARAASGCILRQPKRYAPEPLQRDGRDAARLWQITTDLAASRGLQLPS